MMGLSMKERKPVIQEFALRYRAAKPKAEKTKALDDFIATTGYIRTYGIAILGGQGKTNRLNLNGKRLKAPITHRIGKSGSMKYATVRMWPPAWYSFSRGSAVEPKVRNAWYPFIGTNIAVLTREPQFGIIPEIRVKLVQVSHFTVEGMLKGERKKHHLKGRPRTKPGSLLMNQIPVQAC
ncbi:hypothetical protein Holit_02453 [Hollandina sp. SP2]